MKNEISVVIPSYKNNQQLMDNLSHNWKYMKNCEVIVVNDDPTESIAADMKKFEGLVLIENSKNMGFGSTVNIGVQKASADHVMFLNTDVVLFDDSFKKSLSHFKNNAALFGVSFAQKERDGKTIGKNRIYWKSGFIYHRRADDLTEGLNGWTEGGSCMVDKAKFLKIGGFDPLFAPFYWEDTDLSYRAWKCGYSSVFAPDICVEHHHESTIGKYFNRPFVKAIDFRNQLIFIWKNIFDMKMLLSHILQVNLLLLKYSLKGEWFYLRGYMGAIKKLPVILEHRHSQKKYYKMSDGDVLKLFHE